MAIVALAVGRAEAQITLDGSLGPARALTGPAYAIDASLGQVRGGNLFHSFGRFNVRAGESATFSGPASIANILGRVTGGEPSAIDGLLRSTIPGANLFLLNPQGVIVGPGARLDVGGSLHVGTADLVRLADGGVFRVDPGAGSVLTAAPPAAFGFLTPRPVGISMTKATLEVGSGQSLSLIGGDTAIRGARLRVAGGRISLVSVGSPGELVFDPVSQTPELAAGGLATLGHVEVSGGAVVETSGGTAGRIAIRGSGLRLDTQSVLASITADGEAGTPGIDIRVRGSVVVDDAGMGTASTGAGRAGDVLIVGDSVTVSGGGFVSTAAIAAGRAGDIHVSGRRITITGRDAEGIPSRILSEVQGRGDAGSIRMTGDTVLLEGGRVFSNTLGPGRAGDIALEVRDLGLTGSATVDSSSGGPGAAGAITVAAGTVTMTGEPGGAVPAIGSVALGAGDAGRVSITAGRLVARSAVVSTLTTGAGRAGAVTIDVDDLELAAGSFVDSSTRGGGAGGSVAVTARRALTMSGGSALTTVTGGDAAAGSVQVTAGAVRLAEGSAIAALSAGRGASGQVHVVAPDVEIDGGLITTRATGPGPAGGVRIEAGRLRLAGGGQIEGSTTGAGPGGTVVLEVLESVSVTGQDADGGPSAVATLTLGSGHAGQVSVSAPVVHVADGGTITARSLEAGDAGGVVIRGGRVLVSGGGRIDSNTFGSGSGGTVEIDAREQVTVAGARADATPSSIESGTAGSGAGGRIVIRAPQVHVDASGTITARTLGGADGGAVVLEVGRLLVTGGGVIDSLSRGAGRGGTVSVTAAESVEVRGAPARDTGLSTTALETGAAGDLTIVAPEIRLADGASLASRSLDLARAGTITLVADRIRLAGGAVRTDAARADGGDILLRVGTLLDLRDSELTAAVGAGGTGGNVVVGDVPAELTGRATIDDLVRGPRFVVLDGSRILANAPQGTGGNILIRADVFLERESVRDASGASAERAGTVALQADILDVSGTLGRLPESVLEAAALLRAACVARLAESQTSSLTVSGREGMPPEPGRPLPSPRVALGGDGAAAIPQGGGAGALAAFSGPGMIGVDCRR